MASVIYNSAKQHLMDGGIDLDTNTIKVALVTSSYTPDQDAHEDMADVTNEVSGTGYTAGGKTLTTPTVTKDNTGNAGVFDADDLTWSTSTITARGAVIYKSTGTPANDYLLCYIDFGSDKISSAGDFIIAWDSAGIFKIA